MQVIAAAIAKYGGVKLLKLRTKHEFEHKDKVLYARQVFISIAVAMVIKF